MNNAGMLLFCYHELRMKQTIRLNTGAEMPLLGLGTWNASAGKVATAVEQALLEVGYTHIDCAHVYENEVEVGKAFASVFGSGKKKREEVFITSKLWNEDRAPADVLGACEQTLQDLQLGYVDLYLMHFGIASPKGMGFEPLDEQGMLVTAPVSIRETWEAMEALVERGLVKAIGVSNFTGPMLVDLFSYAKVRPAVNQIELHPYLQQTKLLEFCHHHNIAVTAYSPLGSDKEQNNGKPALMEDLIIQKIAKAHGKTPAQILLRWGIERKTVVIPKSTSLEHIKQNADVFDFALTNEDKREIAALNRNLRYVDPYDWWKIPYFDC